MRVAPVMFEIEKDVPVPPDRVRNGVGTEMRVVLPNMKVGESFVVPGAIMKRESVRVTVSKWQRDNAPTKKFTARAVDGGTRVWRTA